MTDNGPTQTPSFSKYQLRTDCPIEVFFAEGEHLTIPAGFKIAPNIGIMEVTELSDKAILTFHPWSAMRQFVQHVPVQEPDS